MLAQRISSINAVSTLCEELGTDVQNVSSALGADTRNSVAVHIVAQLAAELPQEIAVFDPGCAVEEVGAEIQSHIKDPAQMSKIRVHPEWREAVDGAAAVCILTPWDQFRGPLPTIPLPSPNTLIHRMDDATLSRLLQGDESDPTEADILELEQLVLSQKGLIDEEDPLFRLRPQDPCEKGCRHCAIVCIKQKGNDPVLWDLVGELSWVFDGRNIVDGIKLRHLGFKVHSVGKGLWF